MAIQNLHFAQGWKVLADDRVKEAAPFEEVGLE
jgi:hypothetical protein